MQCQSTNIPTLEQDFKPIPTLIHGVTRYSLMCANALADRNLPWFTLDVAKEIFEVAQNMLELYSAQKEEFGIGKRNLFDYFLGMPPVLVHADLWPGNILWEKNERDKEARMLAIVDWQNCHAGERSWALNNFRLIYH